MINVKGLSCKKYVNEFKITEHDKQNPYEIENDIGVSRLHLR